MSEIIVAHNPLERSIIHGKPCIVTNNVVYQESLTLAELSALPQDLQESYLLFLNRIGVNDSTKLSKVLETDPASAERLATAYELFGPLAVPEQVAKVQDIFEEGVLDGRRFATINLKSAVAKAQTISCSYPAGRIERAVKGMLKDCAAKMKPPLPKGEIEIARKNVSREQKNGRSSADTMKKTDELYGLEKTIGKTFKKMDENDLEKAIAGCPIEPIHDEEQFLNNESYIRSLFCYFPHIPTSRIVEYLFSKGCGCTIFKKVQAKIRELGIRQNVVSKDESLYEQAAFIGWATKDVYKGLEFIAKYAKGKKEDMKLPGASIDTQSQNPKQENAPVEERDMTKAKPIPVETYEQEIAPAKKCDTPQTDPAPTKEPAAQTVNVRFEAVMSGELSQILYNISTMIRLYDIKIDSDLNID